MNIFEQLSKDILKCVKKEKKTLENNLPLLGYLMDVFNWCYLAGRSFNEEFMWDNPKNDIIDIESKFTTKTSNYGFLVAGAWDFACRKTYEHTALDLSTSLRRKINKTFEDWQKIYKKDNDKWKVYRIVFSSGGFDNWSKDGFYSFSVLDEFELLQFSFNKNMKIPKNILPYIKLKDHKDFTKGIKLYYNKKRLAKKENDDLKKSLKEVESILRKNPKYKPKEKQVSSPFPNLNQYSGLMSIPENAHISYWTHAKIWSEKILAEDSNIENKKFANEFLNRFNEKFLI